MDTRPKTAEEYVELINQALFEIEDLRAAVEYDAESMGGAVEFLGQLEADVRGLKQAMLDGRYQFGGAELPFMKIVERQEMAQDIVANAGVFSDELKATGHTAVYGIFFDTGKSELKPESEQAIGEIAKLLNNDAGLKVYVVGHTDNVGGLESNMKLSQNRADAVVTALVGKHGINAARLKSYGAVPVT